MRLEELEAELKRHHTAAHGWALACCAWDRSVAEDVLQASYLKVVSGRATFGERSTFKTWLFGVIRRTAAEERRRRALRRVVPLSRLHGRPEGRSPDTDPAVQLARAERSERLLATLAGLPARQRELLHLVFYQDMSITQAAEVLGIAIGTARTHYERGKARLRELLREDRP